MRVFRENTDYNKFYINESDKCRLNLFNYKLVYVIIFQLQQF